MNLNIWLAEKNEVFSRFLQYVEMSVAPLLAQGIHPGFTDHTIGHSKRVIEYLGDLIEQGEINPPISAEEVCVLIAAAYTHDIGMQDRRKHKLEEIRERHHILSGDIDREVGRTTSNQDLHFGYVPFDGFWSMTAVVAEGHRKVDLWSPEYESVPASRQTIRLRLLAALIRLADELDVDQRRAPMLMTDLQNYPPETLIHWFKSHYVSGIEIKNMQINLCYMFPVGKGEEYSRIFDRIVGEKIRESLEELQPILRESGIGVQMGKPTFREWEDIRDLTSDVRELAIREAHKAAETNREYQRATDDMVYLEKMSPDLAKSSNG